MQKKKPKTSSSEILGEKNGAILEDQIGQLPEDVLCVIFSHLTLKEAGRTCVLSRRWKNKWTLTPHFYFNASERREQIFDLLCSIDGERRDAIVESERREYIRWVNQVVDSHRGTDLDELVVDFDMDGSHSLHLDRWISFSVRKRVKAIKIDLSRCWPFNFVQYSFMKSAPALPGIECLSSLDLKQVNITGETIEHLLSVCPLLERLCFDGSSDLLNLRVVGPSLKLKYLSIVCYITLESMEIFAPNLVSFRYHNCWRIAATLHFKGLCHLTDLHIQSEVLCLDFAQFSSCFSRLETFVLSCDDYYDRALTLLASRPQLTNLKDLMIRTVRFPQHYNMSGLTNVINSCPLLHKFTLDFRVYPRGREIALAWGNLCPLEYLKEVEISGFTALSHEIEIAKFFLKSVSSLEKLIIDTVWAKEEPREKAEKLRSEVPPGVELLIL